ncbi:MAG TPA: hypothetical protein VHV51_04270 [Polyangiaceae bacterium]|jgi:hypothetical protein|nr:hypothetical protein [Polyangiaceae bacterium]
MSKLTLRNVFAFGLASIGLLFVALIGLFIAGGVVGFLSAHETRAKPIEIIKYVDRAPTAPSAQPATR